MSDPELEQLRNQRLAQMQGQYNRGNEEDKKKQLQQQEDANNSILVQIMDQAARARLNTLKISKPEKAQMVEQMIIRMAKMGEMGGKIDDVQLVSLLESINKQMPKSTSTVKFDRRRAALDSDDEDFDL